RGRRGEKKRHTPVARNRISWELRSAGLNRWVTYEQEEFYLSYSAVGAEGFGVDVAGTDCRVTGGVVEDVAAAGCDVTGACVSAMRRLLSRLRCLVTKVLITCAASLAELLPQFPCSQRTATKIS